jgi:hypothetical protein
VRRFGTVSTAGIVRSIEMEWQETKTRRAPLCAPPNRVQDGLDGEF